MFFFNCVAAEKRPEARALARTNWQIKIDNYKLACQRGRETAAAAMPILQLKYDRTLAYEAKIGQSRCDAILADLMAQVDQIPH